MLLFSTSCLLRAELPQHSSSLESKQEVSLAANFNQQLQWKILFSFSLPEASIVNLFRLALHYQIPLVLSGIELEEDSRNPNSFPLAPGWLGQAIQEQQRKIAYLVDKYQLPQTPRVYIDPTPFRSLPVEKIPALVLQQQVAEPNSTSARLLYIQYGNLSLELGEEYKSKLFAKLSNNLISNKQQEDLSGSISSWLATTPCEIVFNSQQLHDIAEVELKELLIKHAQAKAIKLPSLSQGLAQQLKRLQGRVRALAHTWYQGLADSEVEVKLNSLSWLPLVDQQISQSQLIRNPYFSLANNHSLLPPKLNLLPQVFPLELWFLDLTNPELAQLLALAKPEVESETENTSTLVSSRVEAEAENKLASSNKEGFAQQLQNFFAASSRVVILTNFSCPRADYALCWQELQQKLGKRLFLATPELLEKFTPSALTLVKQDSKQAKSLLIRHFTLDSWQQLISQGEQVDE